MTGEMDKPFGIWPCCNHSMSGSEHRALVELVKNNSSLPPFAGNSTTYNHPGCGKGLICSIVDGNLKLQILD